MYRGITLTPVMSKLFESVLMSIYGDWLGSDHLQYRVFQKVITRLHCINFAITSVNVQIAHRFLTTFSLLQQEMYDA